MTAKLDPKVQAAIDAINKKYAQKGELPMVQHLAESPEIVVETHPTGSISLDYLFGCGGLPKGRVVEVHGQPSSGKTTLCYHFAAQVQKAGGVVAWVDAEAVYESKHPEKMGIKKEQFIYVKTETGEKLLDSIDMLGQSGVDLIVVDSVAALMPEKELEGDMGDQHIGLLARMLSQGLRKITATIHKSKSTVLFINQLRDNIGAFGHGPKTTTPGGKAIPFYSSVRVEVSKIKTLKDSKDKANGGVIKMRTVKNKVAAPFREITLDFFYEDGFDFEGELLTLGLEHGVLTKEGNTFYYGETKLGGNSTKALDFFSENKKERAEIERKIRAILFPGKVPEKPKGGGDKL